MTTCCHMYMTCSYMCSKGVCVCVHSPVQWSKQTSHRGPCKFTGSRWHVLSTCTHAHMERLTYSLQGKAVLLQLSLHPTVLYDPINAALAHKMNPSCEGGLDWINSRLMHNAHLLHYVPCCTSSYIHIS